MITEIIEMRCILQYVCCNELILCLVEIRYIIQCYLFCRIFTYPDIHAQRYLLLDGDTAVFLRDIPCSVHDEWRRYHYLVSLKKIFIDILELFL